MEVEIRSSWPTKSTTSEAMVPATYNTVKERARGEGNGETGKGKGVHDHHEEASSLPPRYSPWERRNDTSSHVPYFFVRPLGTRTCSQE